MDQRLSREHSAGTAKAIRRLVCVSVNAAIDKIVAVDRLVAGEIHRPEILSVVAGGKAVNVARAAARLGLPAMLIPVVAGHAGAWLEEALANEGLATRPVRVAGESRSCLSILDRSTGRLTEIYEAGHKLDVAAWRAVEDAVTAELASDPDGSVVVVSGSLPPGVPADAYARVVRIAGSAGARCAVDIGGTELRHAVAQGPWLVKVNGEEAAAALDLPHGGFDATLSAAQSLRHSGAGLALVSLGVQGAILVDEAGIGWRIGAPPELGPYGVGSGDSLLAGFLAAMAEGYPTAEAARRGSAVAAANALRAGQGEFDPADVARIAPRITLQHMAAAP